MTTPPPIPQPPPLPPPRPRPHAPAMIPAPTEYIWRSGKLLIASRSVSLPSSCVRCGGAGAKRYRKEIYWHEQWIYTLILMDLIPYFIVARSMRKRANYACALCKAHARNQKIRIGGAWGGAVLSVGMITAGILAAGQAWGRDGQVFGWLIPAGLVVLVGTAMFAAIKLPILRPIRMDTRHVYLAGACEAYLQQFPVAGDSAFPASR